MILRRWNNNMQQDWTSLHYLRTKLSLNKDSIKLHLVTANGKHIEGYWLLEITTDGLELNSSINNHTAKFQLAAGKHIRVMLEEGQMNKSKLLNPTIIKPSPKLEVIPPTE